MAMLANHRLRTKPLLLMMTAAVCLMAAGAALASPVDASNLLTTEDRKHLLGDTFQIYYTVNAIPASVQSALIGRRLMGPSYGSPPFPLVDPGKPYNSTDVVLYANLPSRRLIFVAVSQGYCLIAYEQGGIGYSRDAALYRLTGKKAKLTWSTDVEGNCRTLSDVRAAVRAKNYRDGGWR